MATGVEGSALVSLNESEAKVWDHWGLEPQERFLEVGSPPGRVRVQEAGSGPPVLFVHGTGGYGPYWAPLVAGLGGYRCLVVDRPGWGGSDPVDYSQSGYRDFVADLMVDVLDGLGVDRVHSVGASIGDTWALALATKHADRVRSVTLLGSGPLADEVKIPPGIKLLRSPLGALMSKVRWREKMETGQARQSGHGPSLDDGRMPQVFVDWKVEMTNNWDWRVNEREMVRAITGRGGWKPGLTFNTDYLSSVSVPLLMVYGTSDPIASLEIWQSFVAQIPEGRLEVIEEAGHLPWFDNPEHVAVLLRDHFQTATD
jgi:pimeloyl-ACP methyl ester carboxylesterase